MPAIQSGQTVRVRAKGDFYAYVDGWYGRAAGYQSGYVVVKVKRFDPLLNRDNELELLVPEDQLEATPE